MFWTWFPLHSDDQHNLSSGFCSRKASKSEPKSTIIIDYNGVYYLIAIG